MKIPSNYLNTSMYKLLESSCLKNSNKIAINFMGTKMKYSTFLNKVDECSESFNKLGIKEKDVVTLITNSTIEALACIYGLNRLGAVCNLINPLSSYEEIKNKISITSSHYIIASDTILYRIENIKYELDIYEIIVLPESDTLDTFNKIKFIFKNAKTPIIDRVTPYYRFILRGKYQKDDIKEINKSVSTALIVHNNSKSIMLTNKNINSTLALDYKLENIKYLCDYPLSSSFYISSIHRQLINGNTIILVKTFDIKNIDNYILKYKPNIIECSPNVLKLLILNRKLNKHNLSFIKGIICGKDNLSDDLYKKSIKFLTSHNSSAFIKTVYGMMECTSNITIMDNEYSEHLIGKPIKNVNIKIVNIDTNKECKPNEVGRICINGLSVMKGYLNSKDESLKKIKNEIWLYTDDLGYIDEKGNLYFKSSMKRIIISNGNEIYPNELESIINSHPYVKMCSIIGVPHPYKKEVVKAYIVLKDGLVLNSEIKKSIREYCEKNISKYALPYAYAYRHELPKNTLGKVSYQKLACDNNEEE